MLLYNVTTIVDESIAQEWQEWMLSKHIPDVMNTGLFVKNHFLKVLDSPNEGVTYSAQFIVKSKYDYELYLEKYATELREEVKTLFKEQLVSFRTLMEYVTDDF